MAIALQAALLFVMHLFEQGVIDVKLEFVCWDVKDVKAAIPLSDGCEIPSDAKSLACLTVVAEGSIARCRTMNENLEINILVHKAQQTGVEAEISFSYEKVFAGNEHYREGISASGTRWLQWGGRRCIGGSSCTQDGDSAKGKGCALALTIAGHLKQRE